MTPHTRTFQALDNSDGDSRGFADGAVDALLAPHTRCAVMSIDRLVDKAKSVAAGTCCAAVDVGESLQVAVHQIGLGPRRESRDSLDKTVFGFYSRYR